MEMQFIYPANLTSRLYILFTIFIQYSIKFLPRKLLFKFILIKKGLHSNPFL